MTDPAAPVTLPVHRSRLFAPPDMLSNLQERGPIWPLAFPDHTRYRRMLLRWFSPQRMRQIAPRIERIVADRLDGMARAGQDGSPVDLVSRWALPIPSLVICELLGVPGEDRDTFTAETDVMVDLASSAEEVAAAQGRVVGHFGRLIERRRHAPADDLISGLIAEGQLDDEELRNISTLLLFAGFETTAQMLAVGTFALLCNPEQGAALRNGDSRLAANAVEELLRYVTIIQFGIVRAALEDVEIDGTVVRAGEVVNLCLPVANRDPEQFAAPDVLDVRGSAAGHLAFGHGIHLCLGAALARLELRIALPALLRRFPALRMAVPADQVPIRTDATVYGLQRLPVTWDLR